VKIAQDALNKVAYNDDKQIKHIEGHLYYDADERMEIVISP
jgi:Holliday junction resolvase RusA-like endonuclease